MSEIGGSATARTEGVAKCQASISGVKIGVISLF